MKYVYTLPEGGRLELDTDAVSDVFIAAGTEPVNQLAAQARDIARGRVRGSGKRFVGMRAAKVFQMETPKILGSSLSGKLRGPVALVYNNSRFAVSQEVGSTRHMGERPLLSALRTLGSKSGIKAIRDKELSESSRFVVRQRASRRARRSRR
jgi:hypothetical protein